MDDENIDPHPHHSHPLMGVFEQCKHRLTMLQHSNSGVLCCHIASLDSIHRFDGSYNSWQVD